LIRHPLTHRPRDRSFRHGYDLIHFEHDLVDIILVGHVDIAVGPRRWQRHQHGVAGGAAFVAQYASRIDQLSTKYDKLTTQISAASTLKSMISSLATSLGTRVRTGDLAVTPTIANASVATVTREPSRAAAPIRWK
jgi:hypothetical protein